MFPGAIFISLPSITLFVCLVNSTTWFVLKVTSLYVCIQTYIHRLDRSYKCVSCFLIDQDLKGFRKRGFSQYFRAEGRIQNNCQSSTIPETPTPLS